MVPHHPNERSPLRAICGKCCRCQRQKKNLSFDSSIKCLESTNKGQISVLVKGLMLTFFGASISRIVSSCECEGNTATGGETPALHYADSCRYPSASYCFSTTQPRSIRRSLKFNKDWERQMVVFGSLPILNQLPFQSSS